MCERSYSNDTRVLENSDRDTRAPPSAAPLHSSTPRYFVPALLPLFDGIIYIVCVYKKGF